MQAEVKTLDNGDAGSIELSEGVFGLPARKDILHRVVTWQLAKRRAGTHKVKERGEVRGAGGKIYKQKGTGKARHSDRKAHIFVGGGVVHGPRVRDHGFSLPKKVRSLGLRTALSVKQAEGKLIVLDDAKLGDSRTKTLKGKLEGLGWQDVLIIDGAAPDENLQRAARNLPKVQVLPCIGANVYDILLRDTLVLTKAAVEQLEARLK
tara:strand:- start:612 stop:1232 length:621 start_codon:yes stop_codon:yes gene_type:complete